MASAGEALRTRLAGVSSAKKAQYNRMKKNARNKSLKRAKRNAGDKRYSGKTRVGQSNQSKNWIAQNRNYKTRFDTAANTPGSMASYQRKLQASLPNDDRTKGGSNWLFEKTGGANNSSYTGKHPAGTKSRAQNKVGQGGVVTSGWQSDGINHRYTRKNAYDEEGITVRQNYYAKRVALGLVGG